MSKPAGFPFKETEISSDRSMSDLQTSLRMLGFDVVAGTIQDRRFVAAKHGKIEFRFEADVDRIIAKTKIRNREQAERIAWRYLAWQTKSLCDGVKLGLIEITQAFGGYLVFRDPKSQQVRALAGFIAEKVESGELDSSQSMTNLIGYNG